VANNPGENNPGEMDHPDRATKFVQLLTTHQRPLYAYINTLLVGQASASDVLQDTNLDLWARLGDYDFDRPFMPWAYAFAYQRVLAFRKKQRRSKLLFSDEIVQLISDTYVGGAVDADQRVGALQSCLERLPPQQRQLIRDRYAVTLSVNALAARLGCSANQMSARLYRIRRALAKCVDAAVAKEMRL
jgi:RNA polymerase sigma-70 factor, ECF subfamily